MGDQDKKKSMENPDVVHKDVMGRGSIRPNRRSMRPHRGSARFLSPIRLSLSASIRFSSLLSGKTRKVVLVESKGHVPRLWPNITKPLA